MIASHKDSYRSPASCITLCCFESLADYVVVYCHTRASFSSQYFGWMRKARNRLPRQCVAVLLLLNGVYRRLPAVFTVCVVCVSVCMRVYVCVFVCVSTCLCRFRKNLDEFLVVHPSFFIKACFAFFRPFVSVKFWRKLRYVRPLCSSHFCLTWAPCCAVLCYAMLCYATRHCLCAV